MTQLMTLKSYFLFLISIPRNRKEEKSPEKIRQSVEE